MTTVTEIRLKTRPTGAPTLATFELAKAPLPEPAEGEVRCRTLFLSLDPYMRGRISGAKGYTRGVEPGEVMVGECVAEVTESRHPAFHPGQVVVGGGGWRSHFVLPGQALRKIDKARAPISTALGILGMPGMTAWVGLMQLAKPKAGETVVMGAATGAVGAVAGQLAKVEGCRVVGVAGGPEKCRYAVDSLGFDVCLDRHAPDLAAKLAEACPAGIDIYLELVGGAVSEAALPLLNLHARMPVIGGIAHYNASELPEGPDRTPLLMRQILVKRLRLEGMIVTDHEAWRPVFEAQVGTLLQSGRLHYKEDVVDGLENAPEAFIGMLEGRNFGKLLVKVAD
jgi:NADPH-dependent curcumin reductase CurA